MNRVVKILMERDEIEQSEAEELVAECREELTNGNFDAISEVLGLEDDYIFDII